MKDPKTLLKKAVEAYRADQGASDMGSYRDAITDLLHMAFNDKELRKGWMTNDRGIQDNLNWDAAIKDYLIYESYDTFEEERETTENTKVGNIPDDELALHVNDIWEFESSRNLFNWRLKK